jgi:hypothetical protein
MAHLITLLNLFAAVCSALAAYRWYQATQIKEPATALLGTFGWAGGDQTGPTGGVDAKPLVEWVQESGRLNKVAATWSAVAAVFAFLSWGLGLLLAQSALAHP